MCFHQDTGREADGEHKTGSIFANAASVLSMAAEEISLDDHLEKELANEVELWRMETSSTAMAGDAYRTVFAPLDKMEKIAGSSALDSNSVLSSPDRLESIEDIDDLTEYGESRGRGSADFYGNGRRKLAPVGTTGIRESTGLSTEDSGMRQTTSSPLTQTQSREGTNITWREVTTLQHEATAWREVTTLHPEVQNVGPLPSTLEDDSQAPSGEIRERVISLGARPLPGAPLPGSTTSTAAHLGPSATGVSTSSGPPSGSPTAPTGPSSGAIPQSQGLVPVQHEQTDVPEYDQALPNEVSSRSSSEEDSFPGFIEDPFEKDIQEQVREPYAHGAWVSPGGATQYDVSGYFEVPEGTIAVKTLAMDPIVHHGQRVPVVEAPGEPKNGAGKWRRSPQALGSHMPTKIAQGVRADRDAF
jgi:hypothetical protein